MLAILLLLFGERGWRGVRFGFDGATAVAVEEDVLRVGDAGVSREGVVFRGIRSCSGLLKGGVDAF